MSSDDLYRRLQVISRDGVAVPFDSNRIELALKKAYVSVEGEDILSSQDIHVRVIDLTDQIVTLLEKRYLDRGVIHLEAVQDLVELTLMRADEYQVARSYVLYREKRRIVRKDNQKSLLLEVNKKRIYERISNACWNFSDVDPNILVEMTLKNVYEGVTFAEIDKAMILSARALIETNPNYSYVAAQLLLSTIGFETDLPKNRDKLFSKEVSLENRFVEYVKEGVRFKLLKKYFLEYDLNVLGAYLKPSRNFTFTYHGLKLLYDRYFLRHNGLCIETPQMFFMRVAMGLAYEEECSEEQAMKFYDALSSFDFMCSTPTLFNSGTLRPQLSSCFITTIPDDLKGIYSAIGDNAMLSKFAGGLGNDWTPVRALGSHIKGTNGKSLGIVPFLNVVDATAVAVNQGGKRKGAVCAYLESWHMDIEEFLELRKNTGDERRRTHDMNTANWIPDLFMKYVFENKTWFLFSPDEVPDLHDLYGKDFEAAYLTHVKRAQKGKIRYRKIEAKELWRKMLTALFETGHPWITFKDTCNLRSPQQHTGVIHSSNLCTEITLNTSKKEIAVCNLGSLNLAQHIKEGQLNTEKLKKTVNIAVTMLNNVIDVNYYSLRQAKKSNLQHRPIGLGIMGFQDALYQANISYDSIEAVEFADRSMEYISYYAIEASMQLATERGSYSSYEGSLWSKGILPIDSMKFVAQTREAYFDQNREQTLDWDILREQVKKFGMRNSNVIAIAPTATIANICGVTQSTEPTYQNLFVKSNLSGEFTEINRYLVQDLKKFNLWGKAMLHDLKYNNGSVQNISRIPDEIKNLYKTAFEIEPRWLIEAASRRQKWIDQGHSLNLYLGSPSGKILDILYRMAWVRGLKTTYYLRTLGASSVEKSTITDVQSNVVSANPLCIEESDCAACQ